MYQILISIILLAVILYLAIRDNSLRRDIIKKERIANTAIELNENLWGRIKILETQLTEEKQIKENLRNTLNLLSKPKEKIKKDN